jgi:hypothetical protein
MWHIPTRALTASAMPHTVGHDLCSKSDLERALSGSTSGRCKRYVLTSVNSTIICVNWAVQMNLVTAGRISIPLRVQAEAAGRPPAGTCRLDNRVVLASSDSDHGFAALAQRASARVAAIYVSPPSAPQTVVGRREREAEVHVPQTQDRLTESTCERDRGRRTTAQRLAEMERKVLSENTLNRPLLLGGSQAHGHPADSPVFDPARRSTCFRTDPKLEIERVHVSQNRRYSSCGQAQMEFEAEGVDFEAHVVSVDGVCQKCSPRKMDGVVRRLEVSLRPLKQMICELKASDSEEARDLRNKVAHASEPLDQARKDEADSVLALQGPLTRPQAQ